MKLVVPVTDAFPVAPESAGAKVWPLALFARKGVGIPLSACVTPPAYHSYLQASGLEERMNMELSRKGLGSLKLEEIWDLSLKLRSMLLNTPVPKALRQEMMSALGGMFGDDPVAVCPSPPQGHPAAADMSWSRDGEKYARGTYMILDAVKMVWASLWADGALLFCRDNGMDPLKAATAVLVRERIHGERHGTVFSRCPWNEDQVLVESLGDRWLLDRSSGRVCSFDPAPEGCCPLPADPPEHGRAAAGAPGGRQALNKDLLGEIHALAILAGETFSTPGAVDWAISSGRLIVLQAGPACRGAGQFRDMKSPAGVPGYSAAEEGRTEQYETGVIFLRDISDAAEACQDRDLSGMPDPALADEIEERLSAYKAWKDRSFKAGIELAHGMALFGRIYNDAVRPVDPCEFMEFLICETKARTRRTRLLEMMARIVRYDEDLRTDSGNRAHAQGPASCPASGRGFMGLSALRLRDMPDLDCPGVQGQELMARQIRCGNNRGSFIRKLTQDFLLSIPQEDRETVAGILDMARTDCMIRDQAGIHLGRLKKHLDDALDEGRRRIDGRRQVPLSPGDVILGLRNRGHQPRVNDEAGDHGEESLRLNARQIVGHPAGRGIAVGRARIMYGDEGPLNFRKGEILVSDTIGPANAFVIPLADAVVIERGGMLVNGALLAREYMIPCITGVSDATTLIRTGDRITVDGHLGIVTIEPGKRDNQRQRRYRDNECG